MFSARSFRRRLSAIDLGRRARLRPSVESMERRSLLSITVNYGFAGVAFGQNDCNCEPPDTIVAVGPNNVVEMVNTELAIYTKAGALQSKTALSNIFSSDGPSGLKLNFSDPQITYDEQQTRFFFGVLAYDVNRGISHFDYALLDGTSPTLTPLGGSTYQVNTSEGQKYLGDFPRIGWNADAYFVTTNQYLGGQSFSHVLEVTIAKSTMAEVNRYSVPGSSDFTVVPATIHDAQSGGPEWLIEEHGYDNGHQLQAIQMVDVLNPTLPGFGSIYVTVPSYGAPPSAAQPKGQGIDTGDTRILTFAGRNGHLVATQNVGAGNVAHARIYDMVLGGGTVTLNQTLEINPGNGISTYYPAADINDHGDLGITYMESSRKENMSMYVTGRMAGDPLGRVQTPKLAKAGEGTYYGSRAGDYSGVGFDPSTGQFWAGSEYARTPANASWGTWIAGFSVTSGGSLLAASPARGSGSAPGGPPAQTGLPIPPLDEAISTLIAEADDSSSRWDWLKE